VTALKAVLRVRSLMERRALAEHAMAEREAAAARATVEHARAARSAHRSGFGPMTAAGLTGARAGAMALHDDVLRADQQELAAGREAELAGQRRVEAAIARRSVERLDERRTVAAATAAAKRVERQLDDLAIDRWRRA
jgi:flagellar biosynthesis chaperone FliJ